MKLKDKLTTVWTHDADPLSLDTEREPNETDADFWARHHAAVFVRFQSPQFEPDEDSNFTTYDN